MQQNRTIIPIATAWLLMLTGSICQAQEQKAQTPQAFELRQENDSLYWLIATGGKMNYATGGNKAEGWRLRYKRQHIIHQHSPHTHTVAIGSKTFSINLRQQEHTADAQPIHQEVLHAAEPYQLRVCHIVARLSLQDLSLQKYELILKPPTFQ